MDVYMALGLLVLALLVGAYGTIIGAGGGFVLIPALVVIFDIDGVQAVGTGAVALAVIGLTGARNYDRSGLVNRPVAGWFSLASIPMAIGCGWLLANRIDSEVFVGVLGVLLLVLGVLVLLAPAVREPVGAPGVPPRRIALLVGGAGVGAMSGTFSVGGGLVTVPYISRIQHLGPHRAAATTAMASMASSSAAALGHSIAGNVLWDDAAILVVGAFLGASVGSRQAGRLAPRAVLGLLSAGLIVAAVPLIVRSI